MKKFNIEAIRNSARISAPSESCGLVVSRNGAEHVVLCRNIAEHPAEHFILHPEDYLQASRTGSILAIWHTHPITTAMASKADRSACNRSGLPWYIYSVPEDRLQVIYPDGKETPLLGRQFVWGVHDCWTLVKDYYQYELGINLPFDEPYPERFWEKGLDYYGRFAEIGFVRIPEELPREHDLLVMSIHSPVPNHGAVLLGNGNIIHHLENRLSCPDVYGGYWREITCGVLRHKELL